MFSCCKTAIFPCSQENYAWLWFLPEISRKTVSLERYQDALGKSLETLPHVINLDSPQVPPQTVCFHTKSEVTGCNSTKSLFFPVPNGIQEIRHQLLCKCWNSRGDQVNSNFTFFLTHLKRAVCTTSWILHSLISLAAMELAPYIKDQNCSSFFLCS